MNYIELINLFWSRYDEHELSATDALLYFHLMDICNKCNWCNPFKRRNTVVCAQLRMSKSTFLRCRDALKAANLIDFDSAGKGDNNITYRLITTNQKNQKKSKNYTSNDTIVGATVEASNDTSVDAHNKNINSKQKHKPLEEVEVNTRAAEIENAITDYCEGKNENSEKEKSSAQKEKELPPMAEAMAKVAGMAVWRNCVEHHGITEQDRPKLFKYFYEQKEDAYKIRYPTVTDMANNFYFWISSIKRLGKLNDILNGNEPQQPAFATGKNTFAGRTSNKDKRAELLNLKEQSTEFLRRTAGT